MIRLSSKDCCILLNVLEFPDEQEEILADATPLLKDVAHTLLGAPAPTPEIADLVESIAAWKTACEESFAERRRQLRT